MRKWTLLISLAAVLLLPHNFARADDLSLRVGVGVGYGYDTLKWNIAGPGGVPNVLSELDYEDIESAVGRIDLQAAGKTWSVDGEITYGLITNGQFTDDDYALNNRGGLFSESTGSVDDHDLQGAALMVGYALARSEALTVRLLVGGRVYRQRLRMTDGVQQVPATGGFANLNSTYTATWYGPAFGFSVSRRFTTSNFGLYVDGTGMPLWYDGQGKWNLRSAFQQDPSFEHDARGWGLTTNVKLSYFLGPGEIFVGGRYLYFAAFDGDDTTFFSDGTQITTPFNEVEAQSVLGYAGVGLNW